jgi:hypothetical protein
MVMTARHLLKRAPSEWYSSKRARRPSRPSVTFSPGCPARSCAPVSTLIPGTTPFAARSSANGVPSSDAWRIVSSYRITPPTYSSKPGVVKRRFRYARRFSSVDSTPIESKRFLIVPVDSSAASTPLWSATIDCAIAFSSSAAISGLLPFAIS